MIDYNARLREELHTRMDRKGWNENTLSIKSGLTQSTVNGILRGRNGATYARAMILLDTLKGKHKAE